MALGKVIGLDAGASWNPSIAIIPTYITNFTSVDDPVELYVSTESNGTVEATIASNNYYTVDKVNNKLFLVKRTSTTSGFDAKSTTVNITITVKKDDTNGYAAMTRTVTIGPDNYTGGVNGISPVLAENTPAKIKEAIVAGVHTNDWEPGDSTAAIPLNGTVGYKSFNTSDFCAYILGFDHNNGKKTGVYETPANNGSNTAGVNSIHFSLSRRKTRNSADAHVAGDIAFVDNRLYLTGSDAGFRMNLSNTNSGGWEKSYMRTVICAQFYSAIDPSWRSYIGSVRKWTDNIGGATDNAGNVTSTWDRIFLMAEYEIFGNRSYANSAEQNYQYRYDYYANNTADSYRIRGADAKNSPVSGATGVELGAAVHWWERSPWIGTSDDTCRVEVQGGGYHYRTNNKAPEYEWSYFSFGFVPNFVITA